MDEIFSALAGPNLVQMGIGIGGTIAGAGVLGALAYPPFRRWLYPEIAEARMQDMIPFDRPLADGLTLRCHDGRLVRVLSVSGTDAASLSMEERQGARFVRRAFFEALEAESSSIELKAISRRRKVTLDTTGRWPRQLLQDIFNLASAQFTRSYVNSHHLVLSVAGETNRARDILNRVTDLALEELSPFGAAVLQAGNSTYSPLMSFWFDLMNPGLEFTTIGLAETGLAEQLSGLSEADLSGGGRNRGSDGLLIFRDGDQETYSAALGISNFGSHVFESTLPRILALPQELTVVQHVVPYSRSAARNKVGRRLRGMPWGRLPGSFISQQAAAAKAGLVDNNPDQLPFFSVGTVVFVDGHRDEVDEGIKNVRLALRSVGKTAVVYGSGASSRAWWSRLPGRQARLRQRDLRSDNVGDLINFEAPTRGDDRSCWAPHPIATFRQINGAPYKFNFHVDPGEESVGHMAVFGPTNAGKTVLLKWLISASLRIPNVQWFVLDRDRDKWIWTKAMGDDGVYLTPQSNDARSGVLLNPIQAFLSSPDDIERGFLLNWLKARCGEIPEELKPQAIDEIGRMIDRAQKSLPSLPQEERSLKTLLTAYYGTRSTGGWSVADSLRPWIADASYGRWVNGAHDAFDVSRFPRLVSIDTDAFWKDGDLSAALVHYMLHRIERGTAIARRPFGVLLDEIEGLLRQNPDFAKDVQRMGQEYRRMLGIMVLSFQRPKKLLDLGLLDFVAGQCPTLIFFRNTRASVDEYKPLGITTAEYQIIKGKHPLVRGKKRYFLIIRTTPAGKESVLIDFDLNPVIGDYLKIFRGGRSALDAAQAAMDMHGSDWIVPYLDDMVSSDDEDEEEEME